MTTNVQVSDLPETTSISPVDFLHVKKTDGVDYKIKQAATSVVGVRDTALNLSTTNPILLSGQWSKETNTGLIKQGDGVTPYNSLPYFSELVTDPVVKTSNFTAKSGFVYLVDTTSNAVNVTLPTPTQGITSFKIVDIGKNFEINNCNLIFTTNKIMGFSEDISLDISSWSYLTSWTGNVVYGWEVD